MSRLRPDGYHVPTARTRRKRRSRSTRRTMLPVLVIAGMIAIPALSIAVSESVGGVAHANAPTTSPPETFSARHERAAQLSATLRTHLHDDQIDAMKTQYLRGRNISILRRDLVRYADNIAVGNYAHVPRELREIIRDNLSKDDIGKVKRWIIETKPSARDLIFTAKTEFAEDLEEMADELMITREGVAKDR